MRKKLASSIRANFINKLKSNKGESLAEVLVAILIIALALVMLLSLINGARNTIATGQEAMSEIYESANAIETMDPSAIKATDGTVTITDTTAVNSTTVSIAVKVYTDNASETFTRYQIGE